MSPEIKTYNEAMILILIMIKEFPLSIFIVGTTGVGKTKLSLELCKLLKGEVINCDSKQLYKYADIMTAKATAQEKQEVKHHMLDHLQLNEVCYNRNKYYLQANKCLQQLEKEQKMPVIIGGTNYYLETLLYDVGIATEKEENINHEKYFSEELVQEIKDMSKEQKYQKLKEVDPMMATKLHPNDETRITSFLNKFAETGEPPSQSYKPKTHGLKNENTILFWIRNSNKEEQKEIITRRIQKMIDKQGLLEILSIYQFGLTHKAESHGIFQAIGYKQFQQLHQKLNIYPSNEVQDYEQILAFFSSHYNELKIDEQTLQSCKQELIKNTLEYSRRQLTWIRNRLFASEQNRSHFFVLELSGKGSLEKRFQEQVKAKALQIIRDAKENGFSRLQKLQEFNLKAHQSIKDWKKYKCEQCGIEANGVHEWNEHLRSKKHKGITKKERKQLKKREKEQKLKEREAEADEN